MGSQRLHPARAETPRPEQSFFSNLFQGEEEDEEEEDEENDEDLREVLRRLLRNPGCHCVLFLLYTLLLGYGCVMKLGRSMRETFVLWICSTAWILGCVCCNCPDYLDT